MSRRFIFKYDKPPNYIKSMYNLMNKKTAILYIKLYLFAFVFDC